MDVILRNKYGITVGEELLCYFIRKIRGCKSIPTFVRRWSYRLYGRKDSLARFWWDKFYGIPIGEYSYGYDNFLGGSIASVGKYCSIAEHQIIAAGNHRLDYVTTSPIITIKEFGFVNKSEAQFYGIRIGNDVWIGTGCIIFDGVTIGDGACIGAGAVIRKDVPPYAVVVGVDCIIRYRFKEDIVAKLLELKWWDWPADKIRSNVEIFKNPECFIEKFLGNSSKKNGL